MLLYCYGTVFSFNIVCGSNTHTRLHPIASTLSSLLPQDYVATNADSILNEMHQESRQSTPTSGLFGGAAVSSPQAASADGVAVGLEAVTVSEPNGDANKSGAGESVITFVYGAGGSENEVGVFIVLGRGEGAGGIRAISLSNKCVENGLRREGCVLCVLMITPPHL